MKNIYIQYLKTTWVAALMTRSDQSYRINCQMNTQRGRSISARLLKNLGQTIS